MWSICLSILSCLWCSFVLVPGIFAVPAGKRGNYSFEINYPKLPQGYYVVYIGSLKLIDVNNGAEYIDHWDWETFIAYDIYMGNGLFMFKILFGDKSGLELPNIWHNWTFSTRVFCLFFLFLCQCKLPIGVAIIELLIME